MINFNHTELVICHYQALDTIERHKIKKSLKKISPEIKMKIVKNNVGNRNKDQLTNYFKGYTCLFYSNTCQILEKPFLNFMRREPKLLLLEIIIKPSPSYSSSWNKTSNTFAISHLDAQKLSKSSDYLHLELLKQKQLPVIQSIYFLSNYNKFI